MRETYIYGKKIKYEESAQPGIDYLRVDLDRKEALVFLDSAKRQKSADFEDDEDRQYTLSYNKDYSFTLIKRGE